MPPEPAPRRPGPSPLKDLHGPGASEFCYNPLMEENLDTPVDSLFADVLGPEYWVSNSGVSRRSWEILLLRKAMLDDHLWSLAECAERYGISRERVRQLEQEAVAKLLAWKQVEDEKRRKHRRRLFESEWSACEAAPAPCAPPPEPCADLDADRMSEDVALPPPRRSARKTGGERFRIVSGKLPALSSWFLGDHARPKEEAGATSRPRRTFAQLRERLVEMLTRADRAPDLDAE